MLNFQNITMKHGSKPALDHINLTLEKGAVYALVGANGSGKSTLMKIAAGLVKPGSGEVTFNDTKIGAYTKSRIAYMSTEPFYYDYMKIKDVGKFYADFFKDFNQDQFVELINFMELTMEMKVKTLSSGMAAKLKIAATLSRDAEVIMLDEPLNGIDLIGRDQIIKTIIAATSPERTIVISSHLLDELEPIVDSVVMLKDGKVIIQGNAENIREKSGKSLVEMYREIYAAGNTSDYSQWNV